MSNLNKANYQVPESSSHCGSKPKKIAIGIAPLGVISIGIVPMGIVTIGIVPMGVVSLGVVAMGVVNASIVGMGIFSAGITTMGIKVWSPDLKVLEANLEDASNPSLKNDFAYATKEQAEEKAKKIGCAGVHKMGKLWMPCATHGTNP